MDKKTTNRGLQEISNIFLSNTKKENKKAGHGLSAIALRGNASCRECVNMIEGSSKEMKCRVFTFENKKYSVPYMATIDPSYANYCENYEPEQADPTPPPVPDNDKGQISPSPFSRQRVDIKELATIISELDQDFSEIEETLTIFKKLAYPDTDTAHKKMQEALFKFIENGYSIDAVDLVKRIRSSKPGGKTVREEKVHLFVKK